ncbi:MAG: CHAD domain-containing protein [Phenylobacterium sp.]|uniref:CYTH and CHAD domain-containing protein n=1 Tax=Phenylobacterium sp. TaxID=1871053 RepID=UPI00391A5B5A
MSDDAIETELKFLCEPADLPALTAALPEPAAGGEERSADTLARYFDTPERDLRRARAGLRVRREPDGPVQTLKQGSGISRKEWEIAVEGDEPDLAHAPLADLLDEAARQNLQSLFEVRVERRKRTVAFEGAVIEIAIDQGEIRAGRRKRRLCEVELELKSGQVGDLFALARRLFEVAPLYLSFETKADQGFALAEGEDKTARAHDQPGLSADMTAAAAFQATMRAALAQIASNGLVLRRADAPEVVHQLRVAARRARSALSTFKPLFADDARLDPLKAELKWLAGACDEARELDVFLAETYRPAAQGDAAIHGLADLGRALEIARAKAHAKARAAVASSRFRALLLDLAEWTEAGAWLSALEDGGGPAEAFAAEALRRRRRKLEKKARGLTEISDAERHKARIAAKKLRYAAEAFRPILKDKAARKLIKKTKKLQDALGALNDAAVTEDLLTGLKLEGPALYAAGHLAGELAAGREQGLEAAAAAWKALKACDDAW